MKNDIKRGNMTWLFLFFSNFFFFHLFMGAVRTEKEHIIFPFFHVVFDWGKITL